jgi:large subunit ribosomal protein L17
VTTDRKAKLVRSLVEKVITVGKEESFNSKRRIHDLLSHEEAEKKVGELGKKYKERKGGYTRILKLGRRMGDNARLVQLELV